MRISLRKKVILVILSLLVLATIFSSVITNYELRGFYQSQIIEELQTRLDAVEYLLQTNPELQNPPDDSTYQYLRNYAHASRFRLTLIDSAGWVIFDSRVSRDYLQFVENHYHRPEIQMALSRGQGRHKRISATINQPLFYTAKTIDSPHIRFIRLAIPLVEINQVLRAVRWKIFGAGGLALLFFAFISYYLANRLTTPILKLSKAAESVKRGNLDAHFERFTHDEIGELADLLNEMVATLREDLIKLRRLEKVRSQFLGNVSHELRTPIFAVQGYLETILHSKGCDPETQNQFISRAYNQAVRLNNLFTDLIDISRIESGELKLSFIKFKLDDWLKKQAHDLQARADEERINLVYHPDETAANIWVTGDQEKLYQVMTNLVENAMKYNQPRGAVAIGFTRIDGEAEIYVADSGRGIEPEHISRIFERFYRVDKERSRAKGGTGLGLAIVKHIVEAHGSSVTVSSIVGGGSIFSFRLKIAKKKKSGMDERAQD